ncbi:MAG: PIN domain-containing protein [Acidimicrobiales bacterium]|nr:PIN domain-containing protein [Acidimicrobiales bacterium]
MSIVVDANVAIAVLNWDDPFHEAALSRCVREEKIQILNVTWAEVLVLPVRLGKEEQTRAALTELGFCVEPTSNEIAELACRLRAFHGNKNFPMLDALVVAFGMQTKCPVVTCDAKWPQIAESKREVLTAHG